MQELDILIPAYGSSNKLERCIASVLRHTVTPFNLLVTVQTKSVAANRNHLLLMGRAPYVAFLDDDVEVPDGWDEKLIETLETYPVPGPMNTHGVLIDRPFVGMVGPRIVGIDGHPQNASSAVPEGERKVEYVCGAVMLWKRERWPDLMADTNFIASQFEDSDLTMQMLVQGGVPVVDGRVTVVHHNEMKANTPVSWRENQAYYQGKWGSYSASRAPGGDA